MAEKLTITNLQIAKQKKRRLQPEDREMLFIEIERLQTTENFERNYDSMALELPISPTARKYII